MNLDSLTALADTWEDRADELEAYGADEAATTLTRCAADLRERLDAWRLEKLTLRQASEESGLAYDTLQHKVGDDLPNAGRCGRPRVRRCDLHAALDAPESKPADPSDPVEDLARP